MTTSILLKMLHRVDSFLEDLYYTVFFLYDCAPVLHLINNIGGFIANLMEYIEKGRVNE